MSQQSGKVTSFDDTFTHGRLSHDQNSGASIQFDSDQIKELKSLGVGERVSFDVVQEEKLEGAQEEKLELVQQQKLHLVQEEKQAHAENIQRVAGDLEAYQDQGGLYS
jgi:cold shock CspA family protein